MATPNYDVRSEYVGDGTLAQYSFDFRITDLSQLLVIQSDRYFNETFRVRGTDIINLVSVAFDPIVGGGVVTLTSILPNLSNLALICAVDAPVQASEFKNKADFTLRRIEAALDAVESGVQRAAYLAQRSVKLPEEYLEASATAFNTEMPIPVSGMVIAVNDTATGFTLINNSSLLLFGTSDPTTSTGINGQYYLNTSTMTFFGPKSGGVWPAGVAFGSSTSQPELNATIANNQSVYTNITGMTANSVLYRSIQIYYSIYRVVGATERRESGTLILDYSPVAGTWIIGDRRGTSDALNVANSMQIVTAGGVGQVQYQSDNMGSTLGRIRWKIISTTGVDV